MTSSEPSDRDRELAREMLDLWDQPEEEVLSATACYLAAAREEGRREGLKAASLEVEEEAGRARTHHREDSEVVFRLRKVERRIARLLEPESEGKGEG